MKSITKLVFASALLIFQMQWSCHHNEKNVNPVAKSQIQSLNDEIRKNPTDTVLIKQRAEYYEGKNDYIMAAADYDRIYSKDSSRIDALIKLTGLEVKMLRSYEAIERLESIYENKLELNVGQKLLQLYIITKQTDKAKLLLNQLLTSHPNDGINHYLSGLLQEDFNNLESAFIAYKKSLDIQPHDIRSWLAVVSLSPKIGVDPDPFYRSALSLFPENPELLHHYAMYLTQDDRLNESKKVYSIIQEIDTSYWDAYYNQGLIYLEQDSANLAIKPLRRLSKENPLYFKGHYYLGVSYELLGREDSAIHYYEEALKYAPNFEEARKKLSELIPKK